ncbi:hypothetical protein [Halodesulfovibrio spirochaetisodalis]|uniref:Uncharacterized protein n=1 Tax=Halodesulfovibrio spirochaetisodalis TaxID=1560234 RepID=A0A1B7XAS1_9BACT|nr:hypothetical protein [Halodesulfovibrio spirochaetisodalis]OBQ46471.1 hypothetical protein SP90_12275 [Halodesulfovibrio spirochaetisodalis]
MNYIFVSASKMKNNDGQYHIASVTKSDELNRARRVDMIAECDAVIDDLYPHGEECLDEDDVRSLAAEIENRGELVCAKCIAEFYGETDS